MHPYLIGFWTTVGPAGLLLFGLFYLRDTRGMDWSTVSTSGTILFVLYALPIGSLIYIYYRTLGTGRPDSSHRKRKRKFRGGVVGTALVLLIIYATQGVLLSPPPKKIRSKPSLEDAVTEPVPEKATAIPFTGEDSDGPASE